MFYFETNIIGHQNLVFVFLCYVIRPDAATAVMEDILYKRIIVCIANSRTRTVINASLRRVRHLFDLDPYGCSKNTMHLSREGAKNDPLLTDFILGPLSYLMTFRFELSTAVGVPLTIYRRKLLV